MAKIALFGDSYIARLEEFCCGDLRVPGDVRFFGFGGMNFDNYSDEFIKLKSFYPDAVFINLGGNSITTETKPNKLAGKLRDLVTELKENGVKRVYVAEITTRGKFRPVNLMKKCFDDQRTKMNKTLRKMYGVDFIVFRDIKYHLDYSTDLIHYNDRGLQKFFYCVRRVLLSFKNI